jgi:FAD/FMN-containing dehydrogenase
MSLDGLRAHRGPVIAPTDSAYDAARESFNALVDAQPEVIVRPTGAEDVRVAIDFARRMELPVSIRGGGHSVAGHSVGDGSVMVDLRLLRDVSVDRQRRLVQVGGGCCWNDVDARTQSFELAMPGGTFGDTGVAGLTLNGGIGHLIGAFGITLDNLEAAEVVAADGRMVDVTAHSEPELFWALRGGGGNFGVVTSFTFRLQEVCLMTGGLLVHHLDDATDVITAFRDLRDELPDSMTCIPALTSSSGRVDEPRVLLTTIAGLGSPSEVAKTIAPLRARKPLLDTVSAMFYSQIQGLYGYMPFGMRNYWTGRFLTELDDDLIGFLVEHFTHGPEPGEATVLIEPFHGAASRVPSEDTAFAFRHARFNVSGLAHWDHPERDNHAIEWAAAVRDRLRPLSAGSYLNYVSDTDADTVEDAYGAGVFSRLQAVKTAWDPDNVFRFNHNISPGPIA